jgi:uncharacterized cupin superfamily protein
MRLGDCAAFPAGVPDGHCFINRTETEVRFLVVGSKAPREVATYSDVDLTVEQSAGVNTFRRKDGRPYIPNGQG